MKNTIITKLGLTLAGVLALTVTASAANITWQAPVNITGDSDVKVSGTLDRAFHFTAGGVGSVTVGTVTFAEFVAPQPGAPISITVGNTVLSNINGGNVTGQSNAITSVAAPFSALSSSYQSLLKSAAYTDGNTNVLRLTLNGLTIGQDYLFQSWVNEPRGNSVVSTRTETLTGGTNTSAVATYNTTQAEGGTGQYLVGSFTATAATQAIDYQALAHPAPEYTSTQIQAFELRATPEPTSAALVGLGTLLLAARRRRSAQA